MYTLAKRVARKAIGTDGRRTLVNLTKARDSWGGRLVLTEEVEHALEKGDPVIALESTIITHGMPHPTNLSTAKSLESILRAKSVTPATIAILDSKIHIGLSNPQLERLSDPSLSNAVKVSRRDIGACLAKGLVGGTTVAGTMVLARSVGIGMFVTGGIGGVHRGAENSMDVSADLIELGRTPMAVICAGAKSILDIPRTLEVLETQGVCVATYGEKPDFPAFYTPRSGMKSPWSVGTPREAADMIHTSLNLPSPLSTLLAVPIQEEYEVEGDKVQIAVEQAVRESVEQGIDKRGKEVTPWLLKRVGELTGGTALRLNVKLIENNARVGAQVAVEVARLERERRANISHASSSSYRSVAMPSTPKATTTALETPGPNTNVLPPPSVLVFGSAAIDITSTTPLAIQPRTTTPGLNRLTPGGVGRNIAEACQNLLSPSSVMLISPIGVEHGEVDVLGNVLIREMKDSSMRIDGLVRTEGGRTGSCSLVLERDGDLIGGVADMGIVETLSPDMIQRKIVEHAPRMVVFDCNLLPETIQAILRTCLDNDIPTFCDPTSTPKLSRLVPALLSNLPNSPTSSRPLTHLSPNVLELDLLHSLLTSESDNPSAAHAWEYLNSLSLTSSWRAKTESFTQKNDRKWISEQGVLQRMVSLLPYVTDFWVKASHKGLLHLRISSERVLGDDTISERLEGVHEGKYLVLTHYGALKVGEGEIVSTTGAGDTLVGGLVAGLVAGETEEDVWVGKALERVGWTMKSDRAVGRPTL